MENFSYKVDRFDDTQVMRFRVPGFEELNLQKKLYIYYLSQAAIAGRDITWDQNYRHNLAIRKLFETLYQSDVLDTSDENYPLLEEYLKKLWFSNGIHHSMSSDKQVPKFSQSYFVEQCQKLPDDAFDLQEGQTKEDYINRLVPILFDPTIDTKTVCLDDGVDVVQASANSFYEWVTQQEAEDFYNSKKADPQDPSWWLNTTLVKNNGELQEEIWKIGGKYGPAIEQIVFWLDKARDYTENEQQKKVLDLLIEYYHTGDLKTFDEYSIAWVHELDGDVDFLNGFIEVYGDALGLKWSWEALVNFKNIEATKRTEIISQYAQWFEDMSPTDPKFKKEEVKWVSAKVITAAMLWWDDMPFTSIGINLPNQKWIREVHGSKSVTIDNITEAYDEVAKEGGFGQEFILEEEIRNIIKKYGHVTDSLHTDLHECVGHGSGKLLPGVSSDVLKSCGSTIEEARADLFGLYFIADPKLVEVGLLDSLDAYKWEYMTFMTNGVLSQLYRIPKWKNIEEAHMKNRALIARWVLDNTDKNIVELIEKDNKHYITIHDYKWLQNAFGQLLAEVQRIVSEWDFESARNLVEAYGVSVDPVLHQEILDRFSTLNIPKYRWFINPKYEILKNTSGTISDVFVEYHEWFSDQMLRYSRDFWYLD